MAIADNWVTRDYGTVSRRRDSYDVLQFKQSWVTYPHAGAITNASLQQQNAPRAGSDERSVEQQPMLSAIRCARLLRGEAYCDHEQSVEKLDVLARVSARAENVEKIAAISRAAHSQSQKMRPPTRSLVTTRPKRDEMR